MAYGTEDIIKALKDARIAKGLSQRALSARTGVPQSHISKIENGATDLRVSSLIEIARALDLDLKLVPRKAVPAVDSVVRSTSPTLATEPTAQRELKNLNEQAEALRRAFPDQNAFRTLQQSLAALKPFSINTEVLESIRNAGKPLRDIQKQLERIQRTADAVKVPVIDLPSDTLSKLNRSAEALQRLRNQLAHAEHLNLPRPAYRLEDDEEDSDA